jgi:hypothetical protein
MKNTRTSSIKLFTGVMNVAVNNIILSGIWFNITLGSKELGDECCSQKILLVVVFGLI